MCTSSGTSTIHRSCAERTASQRRSGIGRPTPVDALASRTTTDVTDGAIRTKRFGISPTSVPRGFPRPCVTSADGEGGSPIRGPPSSP
ncbi:hypothetical protein GS506_07720 [Rhodococcus hoagii]|nr:hypothetical protein [Prescottella equi]